MFYHTFKVNMPLTMVSAAVDMTGSDKGPLPYEDSKDIYWIHDRVSLASAEHEVRASLIKQQQLAGVTFRDEAGTFLSASVKIGRDSVLGVGVQIYGTTTIGRWLSGSASRPSCMLQQSDSLLSCPLNGWP